MKEEEEEERFDPVLRIKESRLKKMKVELLGEEENILHEIADKNSTRDTIALAYAFCISSGDKIDFEKINIAIEARWSFSALDYIKKKARNIQKCDIIRRSLLYAF